MMSRHSPRVSRNMPQGALEGFTLVEAIVVIAITALIMGVLTYLIQYFYKTNNYALQEAIAVGEARHGIDDAMRYLREAAYGSDGSYPIKSAATSSVVFFANVDGGSLV